MAAQGKWRCPEIYGETTSSVLHSMRYSMSFFECCHQCKIRFLGCHDVCPDYKEQQKLWKEQKEAVRRIKLAEPPVSYTERCEIHKKHKR